MAVKALFLDRDGIVCEATPRGTYLVSKEQFKFLDGIFDLVKLAKEKGYLVVVVTNQPQVAKGFISFEELKSIHEKMRDGLGGLLDEVFYCPHVDGDNCSCRKPKPGMLLKAADDFGIDMEQSFFLGDSDKDVGAGKAAGCKTIFLKNKYNEEELKNCNPDFIVNSLPEVQKLI